MYSTDKYLPIPDDKIDIEFSWALIAYQWDIWANVIDTIWYTSEWKDPKDWTYFSYYLTKNKKYFQLMAHLEEDPNSTALILPLLNSTNAEINYSKRFPAVEWDKLWILTWTWNTPIHRIESIKSSWSLDIETTTNTYIANISKYAIISWTWTILSWLKWLIIVWWKINKSCKEIKDSWKSIWNWVYTIIPTWGNIFQVYCDMTTDWGGWTLVMRLVDWWWNEAVNTWIQDDLEIWNETFTALTNPTSTISNWYIIRNPSSFTQMWINTKKYDDNTNGWKVEFYTTQSNNYFNDYNTIVPNSWDTLSNQNTAGVSRIRYNRSMSDPTRSEGFLSISSNNNNADWIWTLWDGTSTSGYTSINGIHNIFYSSNFIRTTNTYGQIWVWIR